MNKWVSWVTPPKLTLPILQHHRRARRLPMARVPFGVPWHTFGLLLAFRYYPPCFWCVTNIFWFIVILIFFNFLLFITSTLNYAWWWPQLCRALAGCTRKSHTFLEEGLMTPRSQGEANAGVGLQAAAHAVARPSGGWHCGGGDSVETADKTHTNHRGREYSSSLEK